MIDLHFDDTIKVNSVDIDGKKYDKVSRVDAQGEESGVQIKVDVNSQLYPMHAGEKFRMVLAHTLNFDGSAVTDYSAEGKQKSLVVKFEYVMHGILYNISEEKADHGDAKVVAIYVSFGGLQLQLKGGDPSKMGKFKVDQRLFLLMRKERVKLKSCSCIFMDAKNLMLCNSLNAFVDEIFECCTFECMNMF